MQNTDKRVVYLQVAVKKLPTAQVLSEALSQFNLQTLACVPSMCSRLRPLLGFDAMDGNLCLVV